MADSPSPRREADSPPIVHSERPTMAEQIASKCVHYTGIYGPGMTKHETCAAGVRYEDVVVHHEPIRYTSGRHEYSATLSRPCSHRLNYCGATCPKAQFPTDAEVAAKVAEHKREVEAVINARAAIVQRIEETGELHGAVICPNCAAELQYSQAERNGHIWARCATQGCVAWME